jgi:hypothetical protein
VTISQGYSVDVSICRVNGVGSAAVAGSYFGVPLELTDSSPHPRRYFQFLTVAIALTWIKL